MKSRPAALGQKKDSGSARQGETTNTEKRATARIALTCSIGQQR
jgi:hypothetical protein